MKTLVLIIFFGSLFCGCATKRPLASFPEAKTIGFRLKNLDHHNFTLDGATAVGQNAKQTSASTGLIGMIVAQSIASSSKHGVADLLKRIEEESGITEESLLDEVFRQQLTKAGIKSSTEKRDRTLIIKLNSVFLKELQRGYWHVSVSVTAKVETSHHDSIWSAQVDGSSPTLRTLEDFSSQPPLYADDFHQAVNDAARQLIVGPIRK